ncbi:MAG: DUF5063 domain-containing protein [Candidatus Acidiferrales bacterium]
MSREDSYTETAERFGAIAQKYCDIVDSFANLERTELLTRIYEALPALIEAAIRLPQTDSSEEDEESELDLGPPAARQAQMSDSAWGKLYQSLKEKLGDADLYWTVFDSVKDNQAINGSLADDIADIYRDLKSGLALKEKVSSQNAI